MRNTQLSTVCAVILVLASLARAPAAGAAAVEEAHPDAVDRGKYVALAADCGSCHSAPGGPPFAGGKALKSAFGTLFASNITPDRETGIGTWTQADFEKALRLGIAKDGSYLYPAMPYDAYTKMSAEDLDALWAYLKTVPGARNIPPKNTLPFPLNVREGLAVWQSAYFTPGPFVPNAGKNAVWNRGAYLIEALAHCSECHTPRNVAQGLENQHLLAGAQISGWYAPDISSDERSTIRRWSTADIAHFLKTGTLAGNVKAIGPMQEAIHDSLRFMTDPDLEAMATYLKDQPDSALPEKASRARLPIDRLTAGKSVYEDECSSCHQGKGQGIPGSVPALAGNDAVTAAEPYNVIMAMLEGFPPQGTWGAMGSFAKTLTDDQIADVTNYVRTAWGNDAVPNATPWSVSTWRRTADAPQDESHALLCPNLASDVVKPALNAGPDALKRAAADRRAMSKLVRDYRAARPQTSSAQVVEALSTAYCRAVAADPLSKARMSAQIADFAQQVALALGRRPPAS